MPSVAKWERSRRDYVLRDGSKFLLRKFNCKSSDASSLIRREHRREKRKKERLKSIYATSRWSVATCGNSNISLGWIADKAHRGKKEIRNLVSLDYWFVSGIYAEILHVEKCFLMYSSRLSLISILRLLLIGFFSYATIQSFEWRRAMKTRKNVATETVEIKIQFVMKVA